jgi:glycosyltransferase involved in cell wall biosynthesis
MAYLDWRYRRTYRRLLGTRCDGQYEAAHAAGTSIMLVSGSLGPGGSERQVVMTLQGLASRGHGNLALLCEHLENETDRFFLHMLDGRPVSISAMRREFDPTNIEDVGARLAIGAGDPGGRLPLELGDVVLYAREILSRRPRVVHTWLDEVNVKAGLAAVMVGVPRVVLSTRSVTPDNFALFRPYMREGYRALMAYDSVLLINNSEAGAREYEKWLGVPPDTIKVIRNGFDFSALDRAHHLTHAREFRARVGIPAAAQVVGSVLRFSEEKQPFLWLEVARQVGESRKDVMFVMVGDGPLREEVRRRADASGIGSRLVMPGYETDSAVAIAAMDVFLLTSRLEGLPNVLIEAQALGVPVVTTVAGGAAETLDEGHTGFAVFPYSADLLAKVVVHVLGNEAWRTAAGEAAQRFVRERFSMNRMTERTLDAYLGRGEFAPSRVDRHALRNTEAIPRCGAV